MLSFEPLKSGGIQATNGTLSHVSPVTVYVRVADNAAVTRLML